MIIRWQRNRQSADRAEVPLHPLEPLTVQLLVLQLGRTLLACLLVLLAVGPLAVHAAVLDEAAGCAVLELDGVAPLLAAVGAGLVAVILGNGYAAHATGGRCASVCCSFWMTCVHEVDVPRTCEDNSRRLWEGIRVVWSLVVGTLDRPDGPGAWAWGYANVRRDPTQLVFARYPSVLN